MSGKGRGYFGAALRSFVGTDFRSTKFSTSNNILLLICLAPVLAACMRQVFFLSISPVSSVALTYTHYLGVMGCALICVFKRPASVNVIAVLTLFVWSAGASFSILPAESIARLVGLSLVIIGFGPVLSGGFSREVIRRAWWIICVFALLITVLSAVAPILPLPVSQYGLFTGLTPNPKTLALNSAIVCALCAGAISQRNWMLLGPILIIALWVTFATGSRSSLLAVALAILAIIIVRRPNIGILFAISVVVAPILVFAITTDYFFSSDIYQFYVEKGIMNTRSHLWDMRLEEFQSKPIFGVGIGVPGEVVYNPSAAQLSMGYGFINETGDLIYEPGSSYLAALSMTGITGVFFLVLLICSIIWRAIKKAEFSRSTLALHVGMFLVFLIHLAEGGFAFSFGNPHCLFLWTWFGFLYSQVPAISRRRAGVMFKTMPIRSLNQSATRN